MKGIKIKEYVAMTLGVFMISLSVENFLLPSKISCGGVSAIGTVLYYIFNIPLSVSNIVFNVLLFIAGYRFLGRESVLKTIFGVIVFTAFLHLTSFLPGYYEDVLAATVAGGVLLGLGLGLVVRFGGSTGGSDFAGIILKKFFPHISVPTIIFVVDMMIILISGIVFGSFTVIIYSGIAIFISSKLCDYVIYIGNSAKQITINSDKSELIAKEIMHNYGRGTTGMYCRGMYSSADKIVVMCVVSPRELPKIMDTIKKIDENAFVVITDVKEVVGKGFKSKLIS